MDAAGPLTPPAAANDPLAEPRLWFRPSFEFFLREAAHAGCSVQLDLALDTDGNLVATASPVRRLNVNRPDGQMVLRVYANTLTPVTP